MKRVSIYLCILFVCCILALAGCGKQKPEQTSNISTSEATAQTPTGLDGATLQPGQTGELTGWAITVTDMRTETELKGDRFAVELKRGEIIVLVDASVTNAGDAEQQFATISGERKFKLHFGDAGNLSAADSRIGNDFLNDMTFEPEQTREGYFVFRVPETLLEESSSILFVIEQGSEKLQWKMK